MPMCRDYDIITGTTKKLYQNCSTTLPEDFAYSDSPWYRNTQKCVLWKDSHGVYPRLTREIAFIEIVFDLEPGFHRFLISFSNFSISGFSSDLAPGGKLNLDEYFKFNQVSFEVLYLPDAPQLYSFALTEFEHTPIDGEVERTFDAKLLGIRPTSPTGQHYSPIRSAVQLVWETNRIQSTHEVEVMSHATVAAAVITLVAIFGEGLKMVVTHFWKYCRGIHNKFTLL